MWDFLIMLIGINGIEALLILLFALQFKIKNIDKFDFMLCWTIITIVNYTATKFIGLPIITQLVLMSLSSVCISLIMNYRLFEMSLVNSFSIFMIYMILEIGIICVVYDLLLNINILEVNIPTLFLLFIPIRLIQFYSAYRISEVFNYENVVRKFTKIIKK